MSEVRDTVRGPISGFCARPMVVTVKVTHEIGGHVTRSGLAQAYMVAMSF